MISKVFPDLKADKTLETAWLLPISVVLMEISQSFLALLFVVMPSIYLKSDIRSFVRKVS